MLQGSLLKESLRTQMPLEKNFKMHQDLMRKNKHLSKASPAGPMSHPQAPVPNSRLC